MSMIRVAVAGAAGRMGRPSARRSRRREDLELGGRADPALGIAVEDVLDGCDVVVDFTRPDTVPDNARAALGAGRHVVIGTTGLGHRRAAAGGRRRREANVVRGARTSPSARC